MSELKEWVSHPLDKLREAYRRQLLLREFDAAGPDSARVAHSLGLSAGELRRLIAEGSQDLPVNELLTQLGLDPETLEKQDPALMMDLVRVCGLCQDHDQCRADLAAGTARRHWREYCLNETTIDALQAEQGAEKRVG